MPDNSLEWLFVGSSDSDRKLFRVKYMGESVRVSVSHVPILLNSIGLGPEVA